ncbi:polysaccharide lyase family 14 protein [Macrolepiota fuliginosa MF-IS2]|uniref:Polysaccharide lyase family 14 protein n=1 Tax=Macrolepiota fuliginosa MF-IS2 TaxID=1400762 RepID=A0A9P6C984_9AGAR|nr:polysaccharide lyase family 14 protein [Macrolepiota fuliginosa MF-IS2]
MSDLSSFNVLSFPSGQQNLQIVSDPSSRSPGDSLQIFYPAHSINPGRTPIGGSEFYAAPIPLSSATNVTLQYSAYFGPQFEFVLAGKMPGLYGGRVHCSGGSDAEDCFSTRLMWRAEGAGELYLYAPRSHQPDSLCSSIGSTCSNDYGSSIARGSFTWTRGDWTTVAQTLVLNTPGLADGSFVLDVNGQRAIDRHDVYYRSAGTPDRGHNSSPHGVKPTKTPAAAPTAPRPTKTSDGGGLLGGILGPLLDGLKESDTDGHLGLGLGVLVDQQVEDIDPGPQERFSLGGDGDDQSSEELINIGLNVELSSLSASASASLDVRSANERSVQPAGLVGIFFSTFFGGHDEKYETPKDQYVWFKDFTITINA